MKAYRKRMLITSIVTIAPMLIGILLWNKMPDTIVTHWGSDNVANGWSSKLFVVFGMPILLLAVHFFTVAIILNDPKAKNIGEKMMALIFWSIPAVTAFCYISIYGVAIGMEMNIGLLANLFVGILFIIIGYCMPKSKQNYTVGIKLPWTLNNVDNWDKTSKLAGRLWIVGGILTLVNTYFEWNALFFGTILVMVIVPILYSFLLYKKGI